ncbi:MAG: CBS domain-containing protein [Enterococcus avium]
MGERADIFLSTFNRIEKELKRQLGNPVNMSFSEAVRRLSKRRDNLIGDSENDLLQLAQLRNAIVHDQVADDFVIAEPNDWAVTRIKQIEESLLRPEKVLPRFGKKVTGFERNLPLVEIMKIITEKRFSQFPVYDSGKFMGLITLRTIGFYFAQASLSGSVSLKERIAEDLLLGNGKRTNFKFVSADTKVSEVEKMFQTEAILEAILITKDGHSDGNLLGIIRPRDIYSQEGEQ